MILCNGVGTNNPRKRERESPINPFFIKQHPLQLTDLTQLHNQQPNAASTGLRLTFGEQKQQLQSQPPPQKNHHHQQRTLSPQSSIVLSLLSEDLATQIRQESEEMEQFLQAQGEQLRRTLAERRQRHYREFLKAVEESAARRLREKETELKIAARRNTELKDRAAQLAAEAHVWQARAREQEATAAELQEQLQQAIILGGTGWQESGKESGCPGGEAEDAESLYVDPDGVTSASGPSCKACRNRAASVVLLPCRHLCLCTECGAVAQSCPLCLAFRESSVEIFLC